MGLSLRGKRMNKIIDVHTHIFPDDVAEEYIKNYAQLSNLHAFHKPTADELIREESAIHASKIIILTEWESSVPFKSNNLKLISKLPNNCYCYSYNEWLGKLQHKHPTLIGFGGVHPDEQDRVEELERMVKEHGLKGLKLHLCMHQFYANDKRLNLVYEKAVKLDIPILYHTGLDPIPGMEKYGHPKDVGDVASLFPDLTLIMAHLGAPFYGEAREVLKKHENVFADTSVFLDLTTINKASSLIKEIGVDRFMFGSDYPFFTPKNMLNKVEKLDISEEEKEMILNKNAIRILKL